VILPEDKLDAWLSGEAGKKILVPYPADQMAVGPINPRVSCPKNDDPGILEPIAADLK
jgi:putative SOS response-associated peptidase YedK